jgi:hypothetical protein
MEKPPHDRRPGRGAPPLHAASRRFTSRATEAAERAHTAAALAQFEPEPHDVPDPPPPPAVEPAPQRRQAPRRAAPRRWPPAPIWLGVVLAAMGLGAWGARQFGGAPADDRAAAAVGPPPQLRTAVPAPEPQPAVRAVEAPAATPTTGTLSKAENAAKQPPPVARAARAPAPATVATRSAAATRSRAQETPVPVAQVAAEPGFRGSLTVASEPAGARVLLNGQPVGVTPLVLRGLPAGSRVVRVEADGYHSWSAAVRVVADQDTQVHATLRR